MDRGRQLGDHLAHRLGLLARADDPPEPTQPRRVLPRLRARNWPALEDAYEQLPDDAQAVLDLRYGLRPEDPARRSAAETGAALDLDPLAVRRIEVEALAALDRFLPRR